MATAPRLTPSLLASQALAEFSSDVVVGLGQPGQKELPSKYLYDEVGSALFDVICLLPEYGLSRAGMRLLKRYAPDIISRLNGPFVVAELGSGSGQKTRFLLEALSRRQRVNYYPIDISGTALHRCQQELGEMDRVSIVGFERAYLDGLQEVAARRRDGEHVLVLFLGSTIGNFDRPAGDQFLRDVRNVLREGDALLLATDLEKSVPQLLSAYDDAAGVTSHTSSTPSGTTNPSGAWKCIFAQQHGSASRFAKRDSISFCAKAKRFGRKVRTNIIRRKSPRWANAQDIAAPGNGLTPNGRSRRTFFSRCKSPRSAQRCRESKLSPPMI
jgi:SAM-dependent methyltransferase